VIENKADSFIYLGSGIGPWDVCASEALIRSVNGIQTKANG
jgi:fructose-1,6-bisphosphatase/inositol monophosphatase family enzyme